MCICYHKDDEEKTEEVSVSIDFVNELTHACLEDDNYSDILHLIDKVVEKRYPGFIVDGGEMIELDSELQDCSIFSL